MDKQRIIFITSALIVIAGVVGAYIYYQKSQSTYSSSSKNIMSKNDNKNSEENCIVIVRGDKYDVSEFRNKHKGGDIFKCGEDMTDIFNNQHGEKQLKELQKYKVN